jgi:hypothetical protein
LDLNPTIRSIIIDAMRPRLWTIDNNLPKVLSQTKEAKKELMRSLTLDRKKSILIEDFRKGSFGDSVKTLVEQDDKKEKDLPLKTDPDT